MVKVSRGPFDISVLHAIGSDWLAIQPITNVTQMPNGSFDTMPSSDTFPAEKSSLIEFNIIYCKQISADQMTLFSYEKDTAFLLIYQ